jgi:hypothetical protein
VPITSALVEQSFGPDQTRAMAVAFEKACESLGLTDTPDRLTDIVARKIVETARTGETDAVRLYEAVMRWASTA